MTVETVYRYVDGEQYADTEQRLRSEKRLVVVMNNIMVHNEKLVEMLKYQIQTRQLKNQNLTTFSRLVVQHEIIYNKLDGSYSCKKFNSTSSRKTIKSLKTNKQI